MTYSYNEAFQASVDYFSGDELAAKVFVDKYALRNEEQEFLELTPTDMHWRIAKELHRIEEKKFKKPLSLDEIFSYLDRFKRLVPQGGPMSGIGNPYQCMTLSNCYVIGTDPACDSYGGICRVDEQLVQISKRRGGVGLDISHIRPAGSATKNAARTSTGIVPFMERYSNSIREVGQSGRRGALLISLSVHHPEVIDFATVKHDLTKVTGANISIKLTDEFLNAVENDEEYEQRWPVDSSEPKISKKVRARDVWDKIIASARNMAEPGLLFWDNIIRESPADSYAKFGFRTISTNPCSELTLSILDSCRLFLANLFGYVIHPFTKDAYFDFDLFYKEAQILQRFMDDMIDLEIECIDKIIKKIKTDPEPDDVKRSELDLWKQIRKACTDGRRTGSGITALADTMAACGIKYGSDESIEFTGKVYKTLKLGCYRSSVDMAKELGAFPVWDYELEKDCAFLKRIEEEDPQLYKDMKKYGRRNIALLTTPPAGSVSIETQTSSGIEPVFMLSYTRRKKGNPNDKNVRVDFVDQNGDCWQEFEVYHPKLKMWMEITGKKDLEKSPYYGCCAEEINWVQRVKLQAAAQKHVDHSISSTINLPEDVTTEQVAEIYTAAWKSGCKGITVYRKNCRTGVLVDKNSLNKRGEKIQKTTAPSRPKLLPADVHHIKVKGEEYFVLVGMLNHEPYEIFSGKNGFIGKNVTGGTLLKVKRGHYRLEAEDDNVIMDDISNYCTDEEEALTRLASISLRHGADVNFIVHQLEKVKGDMYGFAKSMVRVLKKYIKDGEKVAGEKCGSCSAESLQRREGCVICMNCGWSKC